MESYNEFDWVNAHLTADEYVVWKGRPGKGHVLTKSDIFLIPFSLMWGGFAIFWEMSVLLMDAPLLFKLWGIPFVLVGLYLIFGRFIWQQHMRKRTYYAVTNRRVLRLRGNNVDSLSCRPCPEMHMDIKKDGTGTIYFGSQAPSYYRARRTPGTMPFSMENIPEVNQVFRTITEQSMNRTGE